MDPNTPEHHVFLYYFFDYATDTPPPPRTVPTSYELVYFKPSLSRLKLHTPANSLVFLFWYFMTFGKYRIVYVKDGDVIIHFSIILPKYFKFPFIGPNDLEIGPCWTKEEYRGQGLYPAALSYIIRKYQHTRVQRLFMFTRKPNVASQKGILKVGFRPFGIGFKSRLGIYQLTETFP